MLLRSGLTSALLFVTAVGHAADREGGKGNPCTPLKRACENVGYSGKEGSDRNGPKGSARDCMEKWSAGQPVTGLTLKLTDPSLKECVAHLNKKRERKKNRGNDNQPPQANKGPTAPPHAAAATAGTAARAAAPAPTKAGTAPPAPQTGAPAGPPTPLPAVPPARTGHIQPKSAAPMNAAPKVLPMAPATPAPAKNHP